MPQIIPRNSSLLQSQWQKELKEVVTDPTELINILGLSDFFSDEDLKARKLFPLRVPHSFIQRMEHGNSSDPLLLQVMTSKSEYVDSPEYSADPLLEQEAAIPGLLHKYKSRVLVMLKTGCAVNCRYCFRRHFPYQDNSLNKQSLEKTIEYIEQDVNINEVILSGGDPLMAKDDHLDWYIKKLENIPHLTRLRIHTRLPVVIPSRVTETLSNTLKTSQLKTVIVFHINHVNEINDEFTRALAKLQHANITLLNQAVLLKDINDSANEQIKLAEGLFAAGILPYYLHLLDKVKGASHFDVDESTAIKIMQECLEALPGFLMPTLVRENGGKPSKTPINIS